MSPKNKGFARLTLWLAIGALFVPVVSCSPDAKPVHPNVLLISIDTLRADRLGCYGYTKPTSPILDALAKGKDSILFEQCYAQAPNTAPSHMTLLTSLYPTAHAVPNITPKPGTPGRRHADATRPLPQLLKEAGYITAGLTDGGYLHPLLGFGQGFDTYHCLYENISEKVDRAISWLEQNQRAERPFFLFLHTYEVHEPYLPPEPFRNRFAPDYEGWVKEYCFGEKAPVRKNIHAFSELFKQRSNFGAAEIEYLSGLYDGEIAYTDQELGRLWNHLAKAGLWDNLTLIVFSDHGEEFGEHGEFGHKQLFDEVLRVPLLWILPPGRGRVSSRRVAAQVSLIDVMPTLLDFLEIPAPAYLQGRSLRPLWEGDGQEGFPSFSEYIGFEPDPLVSSIRYEGRKLISYSDKHRLALYDLGTDCEETADRSHEEEGEARKLHRMLGKWHERNIEYRKVFKARVQDIEIDSKLYEELKALGY